MADPAKLARLGTFFARASVTAKLLQSRLALPIMYPLNPTMLRHIRQNPINTDPWTKDDIARGLTHVTPIVVGMSKMAPLLKAAHALQHMPSVAERRTAEPYEYDPKKPPIRLDFIRPQRLRRVGRQRYPVKVTKIGVGHGWDDVGSGLPANSAKNRFTTDPKIPTSSR
eukprot:gnl/MRDRNA2_/MRDRNA2_111884_c0_seq1.p1 gnl/MRDRNA2_/MRDRNA2_111884_c0~~gnl/MRDRNA2_/MRDRNA2_111884_c0_seq1.p1  ORF type:complete len:169 (-),score=26.29 gnl/MRDRNA2_/MRDRNA2_111884_c0_seq1:72-578(-)